MTDDTSFDLDAAGLRADGGELTTNVEVLARKLEDALPQNCTVQRKSKRLFGGEKVVRAIAVSLGDSRYAITVDGARLTATREQEVRGVVIKREEIGMDAWVAELTGQLREQAESSAQSRDALARLLS